ncbi:MAG: 50S ribosomal protein L10 [Acidobacteria bacterium]|nr:50S ribosomal protein L10 [Acidobacteriota bacterium]
MKKRSDKHKQVESLRRQLAAARHVFVTGFDKLTVAQDFELRKVVRGAGGRYQVIKNNLAAKAAEGTSAQDLLQGLRGMTSLVHTAADPVALAKALTTYAKGNPSFTFRAGMVEGRAIDVASIQQLASLPPREELLARVLFLIQAPAQRLVVALSGVGRNLAVVVEQGVKDNKFSE